MPKIDYSEWIRRGNQDELSMDGLIDGNIGHPNTSCFLSQQMIEKYMKGLLLFYKQPFLKVHDLLQLATLLMQFVPDIKKLHKDLVLLNGFYIGARYPGDFPDFDWKMAKSARDSAKKIKNFVLSKINE
ncbi:hypothetical protein COY05_00680 [Candidatus Peregrinibacteria bacterium CG_4_10_14_0_2_um_filter_38_24]|nr:MAG: hypothetical protein COY05_00680 [Candidatus Peregrinibacteria bacterium CG_4_10_14_0_2_um_filter_38_24]